MRPVYETNEDREKEASVWKYLTNKYDCSYSLAPSLSQVDGFLYKADGSLAAIVEIKNRRNKKNKYPTYMLSARKWKAGIKISNHYEVPFILVVNFTDGVYFTKLTEKVSFGVGGRYDRNDSMDVEECVYIPMDKFKPL